MKKFADMKNEIKENVKVTTKGKQVKSFSKTDFNALAKAMLNTPEYTVETVKMTSGELTKTEIKPVEDFRNMMKKTLEDFGVDKEESKKVLTDEYEIKNADCMYPLASELVFQYMDAGKKFDFLNKEDFSGGVTIKEIGETTSECMNPRNQEKIQVNKKAHKVLDKKSKCPDWLKNNLSI